MSGAIEYADVRVGDVIEGTYYPYDNPHESITYRGVVTHVGPYHVRTASFTFSKDDYPTLTLVERPDPVEPTKIGTQVKMGNGRTAIRTPLDPAFRPGGDESTSPWLYFTSRGGESWSVGGEAEWLTWGEVLGNFGKGVVEVIEP